MGQIKKIQESIEDNIYLIEDIISFFSRDDFKEVLPHQGMSDLYDIKSMYQVISYLPSVVSSIYVSNIGNNVRIIYSRIREIYSQQLTVNSTIKKLIIELWSHLTMMKNEIRQYIIAANKTVYNSDDYYEEQISELKKQKQELEKVLKEKDTIKVKSQTERELQEKRIQEKESQLSAANQQIQSLQEDLERKKKQDNAIEVWGNKIKSTFSDLKNYLQPIKKEHHRLLVLFWIYFALVCTIIIFIVIGEIIVCLKFYNIESFPYWLDYLTLVLPIPVSGALLWVFIAQLNRAQRQLVVLAKHIHEVEYVEGLLLSLNYLSMDINESMKRVNAFIEKLLDNHLTIGSRQNNIDENTIIKEEKKDITPSETVLRILKNITELSSNGK